MPQLIALMKKVTEVALFKQIREAREYQFGKFYFFDGLVISEINQGVTFNWSMAQKVIKDAQLLFGKDLPISYISNRINQYHIVPADWAKFFNNRHQLDLYCVVGSCQKSFASLVLEKVFFITPIKKFQDLEEAIAWVLPQIKTPK